MKQSPGTTRKNDEKERRNTPPNCSERLRGVMCRGIPWRPAPSFLPKYAEEENTPRAHTLADTPAPRGSAGNARNVVAADVAVAEYKDGAGNAEKVDEVDAEGGARDADAEMVQKTRWGAGEAWRGGAAAAGGGRRRERERSEKRVAGGIAAVTAGERSGDRGGAQRRRQEWQRRRCVEQVFGRKKHEIPA
ncbi:hypothetical protein B0H17DRAFT_1149878 [Mycena rosella]|uniref:Uncharacterized protein n=1 Tax=Mycena rosella TaxID=1033263 RepID=A0AAD7BXZ0_MYCRO|nr:hypothetical protein B0H17DRAFT_1149878 [Mycena rosella]